MQCSGRGLVLLCTGPAHLLSSAQGSGHVEGACQERRFRAGKTAEARDRKSTRLNSSHKTESRMPSSA